MRWVLLALVSIYLASPAEAKVTFVPFPSGIPGTARIGTGGTSSTIAGIDFWRAGIPARPYKWLGFLIGNSEAELLKSVGTAISAKVVRDAGGDALIVVAVADLPIQTRVAIGSSAGAPKYQFWVIKYLPAGAYAVADDDHAKQLAEAKLWTEDQCVNPNSLTNMAMAQLTAEQRSAARAEVRRQIARIADAMANEPEGAQQRNYEMQRLALQMLECQEQRQVAQATEAAIRGGVGTEANWISKSRPAVNGRSVAAAQETLTDGTHCITVTDVIIVNGEEMSSAKRMCRQAGSSGYRQV